MSDPASSKDSAPLTVKVGWGAVLLIVACAVIWWLGVVRLDEILQLDTQCEDKRYYGRGAELAEIARCSIEAGAAGWFYLAWLGIFPFLLVTWLERKLRQAMLARRHVRTGKR